MEQRRLGSTPPIRSESGFTLIEILIAAAIFSVIAVALHSSFSAGIQVWRKAEANMDLNQSIRFGLDSIAKELRNAPPIVEKKKSEPSAELDISEQGELAFAGAKDSLSFITLAIRRLEDDRFRKELAKTSYFMGDDGKFSRTIAFQGNGYVGEEEGEAETLVEGVKELSFEYSYEGEDEESPPSWKEDWQNQEGIPMGVKVRLEVERSEGKPEEFTKIVFIPTGILGKEELISE